MPKKPMSISDEDYKKVNEAISAVMDDGKQIRSIFESYYDGDPDIEWEVDAAVESFDIFSSRWTTEILCCLYVAGPRRFNELRKLLRGISSRTLSDKLTKCVETGLGRPGGGDDQPGEGDLQADRARKGRRTLLGPLVAYMKIHRGRVIRHSV